MYSSTVPSSHGPGQVGTDIPVIESSTSSHREAPEALPPLPRISPLRSGERVAAGRRYAVWTWKESRASSFGMVRRVLVYLRPRQPPPGDGPS